MQLLGEQAWTILPSSFRTGIFPSVYRTRFHTASMAEGRARQRIAFLPAEFIASSGGLDLRRHSPDNKCLW